MKNHHRCPKCSGKRIWVIERYRIPDAEVTTGRELTVMPHLPNPSASRLFFEKTNPVGHFDLYLCDGCGYSELWAEGFKGSLSEDLVRGIRLLDTSDANEGPFR
jgi:predicted nucleic-acid-binding Zn-ribbon protein